MTRFARNLEGQKGEVHKIERPESLFKFRSARFNAFHAPLARILSQARQLGACSVVMETLPEEGELAEESEDLRTRLGTTLETQVWRLCFFTGRPSYPALRDSDPGEFLGYAVLRQDWDGVGDPIARIYESVLARQDRGHNYVRGDLIWQIRCGHDTFEVCGHLFAEQNDCTNVCAHSALRTVCARHMPDQDLSYRQINRWLGIDHGTERHVGAEHNESGTSRGLDLGSMGEVLRQADIPHIIHYYGPPRLAFSIGNQATPIRPPCSYQRTLYGGLESGYPALLIFGRVQTLPLQADGLPLNPKNSLYHVIPIFGHTFNQDMWVPRAETSWFEFRIGAGTRYLPSDLWLSAFIAHDDSLGSNYCIPKHYLPPLEINEQRLHESQSASGVMAVIQTLPRTVVRDPIDAEVQALTVLSKILEGKRMEIYKILPHESMRWFHHIAHELKAGHLVLRPLLMNQEAYHSHLKKLFGWKHNEQEAERISAEYLEATFSFCPADNAFFWMVEVSVMELFPANLRKLGEVLITATDDNLVLDDATSLLALRIPGIGLVRTGGDWSPDRLQRIPAGIESHAQVFGTEPKDPFSETN